MDFREQLTQGYIAPLGNREGHTRCCVYRKLDKLECSRPTSPLGRLARRSQSKQIISLSDRRIRVLDGCDAHASKVWGDTQIHKQVLQETDVSIGA
jgi:hypothetical protein